MTIDEAINRNVELIAELIREGRLEKADGVQLGIEALKQVQFIRAIPNGKIHNLLSGETKE